MNNILKIPVHNFTEREITVVNILKSNEHLEIKSFLNVGFHSSSWGNRSGWWMNVCNENNIDWKILEIYPENVNDTIVKGCPRDKIILGDIMNTNLYENFDCMLFWHGPEHIDKELFLNKLPDIEKRVNKLIIFGMPLGYEPQREAYGNTFEIHLSSWYPEDWKKLGYDVIEVHDNRTYHHITTYKKLI